MLYVRCTLDRNANPEERQTHVLPEDGIKQDIYVFANDTRARFPGVEVEVFEWDGDLISASVEAHRRAVKSLEESDRLKGVLRDWALALCTITAPDGVISTTKPSPLSNDEVKEVFEEVVKNKRYRKQRFLMIGMDGVPYFMPGMILIQPSA